MFKMLALCVVFGFMGLGMECFFTAIWDAVNPGNKNDRKKHLHGYSSIWYLPLYILPPLLLSYSWWPLNKGEPLWIKLFAMSWTSRGLIYTISIYALELLWMRVLRYFLGSSPSEQEYRASKRSFWGLIRWDFFPFWFSAGLFLEGIFRLFRGLPPF